jgi:transcriptional regulator with XRE-family HTH domain
MAIGERIHHFRLLRGFTQKYLGQQLGFSESQADVRIAQYEKGARSPKENYLNALADIFDISPHALAVPDIDSYVGLMHTLFTLEDLYGLHIGEIDGELCLRLDKSKGTTYLSMFDMFHAWQEQAEKLKSGEITQEEYDQWRYNYPKNSVRPFCWFHTYYLITTRFRINNAKISRVIILLSNRTLSALKCPVYKGFQKIFITQTQSYPAACWSGHRIRG